MVIHSSHAGRSALLSRAFAALERVGIDIALVLPISKVEEADGVAGLWKARGINLVVAAGGDGLVGSVARLVGSVARLELARKNVVLKLGDYLVFDCFVCSKVSGLTYCNVEWTRTGL